MLQNLPGPYKWTVCGLGDGEGDATLDEGDAGEKGEILPDCRAKHEWLPENDVRLLFAPDSPRANGRAGSFVFEGEERP